MHMPDRMTGTYDREEVITSVHVDMAGDVE
jgi:hypothetical protein